MGAQLALAVWRPWVAVKPSRSQLLAVRCAFLATHILLCALTTLRSGAFGDSIFHLASGYHFLDTGSFVSYRVNPPIHRVLLALPSYGLLDVPELAAGPERRPEVALGEAMVTTEGFDWQLAGMLGNIYLVLCSCLVGEAVYRLAALAFDEISACVAVGFWAFHPVAVSWATCGTADMLTTCLWLYLWLAVGSALRDFSWTRCVLCGILFGLGLLTRYTFFVFPLSLILVELSALLVGKEFRSRRYLLGCIKLNVVSLFLGLVMVNLAYGARGTTAGMDPADFESRTIRELILNENTRWLTQSASLVPTEYVRGLDVQLLDFENPPSSYWLGKACPGFWYYYPATTLCKSPIAFTVALAMGFFAMFANWRFYLKLETVVIIVPSVAYLCMLFAKSEFTTEYRYMLPVVPILCMFAALAGRCCASRASHWLGMLLVVSFIAESLCAFPNHFAFTNLACRQVVRPEHLLTGSAFDWGQDMLPLKKTLAAKPELTLTGVLANHVVPLEAYGISPVPPDGLVSPKTILVLAVSRGALQQEGMAESLNETLVVERIGSTLLLLQCFDESCSLLREP